MAKSTRRRGISLPWERRARGRIGELLSTSRWKTLLVVALVVAAAVFAWRAADRRARTRATRASIAEVQRAVAAFRADIGRCPRSTVELLHPPRTGARYLGEMPLDGWGRPLLVRCPGRNNRDGADVISSGPSGSFFVDDNIP